MLAAVMLPKGTHVTSARCLQSCFAVTLSGRVYAWGQNSNGQLGDGTTRQRTAPARAGVR
jgi:alpha-tubulin suppressor-like RCC1 family protein